MGKLLSAGLAMFKTFDTAVFPVVYFLSNFAAFLKNSCHNLIGLVAFRILII